jgi:hypothetical protein
LPTGWKEERDGSIRPESPCRKGCEFVSPKLKGYEGLKEIAAAIDQINARGGRVNSSCGLHLSIDWRGDAAALARPISLDGNHEKAIFASTGTRRREQTIYTKQIKQYGDKDAAKNRCEADRYHLLNLTHLAAGRNRIEFRAFAGTLNKTKVVGYRMNKSVDETMEGEEFVRRFLLHIVPSNVHRVRSVTGNLVMNAFVQKPSRSNCSLPHLIASLLHANQSELSEGPSLHDLKRTKRSIRCILLLASGSLAAILRPLAR